MKNQVCGQCVHNCNDRLPTETREQIFLNYWSISDYHRQRDFICSHVLRKTVFGEKRRTANFEYFLTYSSVQTGVLATLGIGERTVSYTLNHSVGSGTTFQDRRGKHSPAIKKSVEMHQTVYDHIASFPSLDSHYARLGSAVLRNILVQT